MVWAYPLGGFYFSVLGGVWYMRVVAVVLVALSENGFIVKKNRGIVWSGVLLLGISVVGSYTEK